jgi:hypothetical protein
MPTTHFCAFCQISGVPGPHDHFVRATRDTTSAVTCPRLLATECSYCRRTGHTAKYCGERKFSEKQAKVTAIKVKKDAFASGEWMEREGPGRSTPYRRTESSQVDNVPKNLKLTSQFAALSCDASSDSEQDPDPETLELSGPSWADVAKQAPFPMALKKRPDGVSWADWNEE